MLTFFSILHVVLAIFMILIILLQPGKDAGMGAALGGGAAASAFGGRGAVTFLSKVTAVTATAFFMTALGLSLVSLHTSVLANEVLDAKDSTQKTTETKATEETEAAEETKAKEVREGATSTAQDTTQLMVPEEESGPTATQGDVADAPGKAVAPPAKPGALDAVPAEKLPPAPSK